MRKDKIKSLLILTFTLYLMQNNQGLPVHKFSLLKFYLGLHWMNSRQNGFSHKTKCTKDNSSILRNDKIVTCKYTNIFVIIFRTVKDMFWQLMASTHLREFFVFFCNPIHKELSHVTQMSLDFIVNFSRFGTEKICWMQQQNSCLKFSQKSRVKMAEFVNFGWKCIIWGWLTEYFVN